MMETMIATLRITVAADMGLERKVPTAAVQTRVGCTAAGKSLELADGRVVWWYTVSHPLERHRSIHGTTLHYSGRFTRSRISLVRYRYADHCAFTSRCVTLSHSLSLSLSQTLSHTYHTCDDFRLLTFVAWMLPRRSPGLRSAGGSLSLTRTGANRALRDGCRPLYSAARPVSAPPLPRSQLSELVVRSMHA